MRIINWIAWACLAALSVTPAWARGVGLQLADQPPDLHHRRQGRLDRDVRAGTHRARCARGAQRRPGRHLLHRGPGDDRDPRGGDGQGRRPPHRRHTRQDLRHRAAGRAAVRDVQRCAHQEHRLPRRQRRRHGAIRLSPEAFRLDLARLLLGRADPPVDAGQAGGDGHRACRKPAVRRGASRRRVSPRDRRRPGARDLRLEQRQEGAGRAWRYVRLRLVAALRGVDLPVLCRDRRRLRPAACDGVEGDARGIGAGGEDRRHGDRAARAGAAAGRMGIAERPLCRGVDRAGHARADAGRRDDRQPLRRLQGADGVAGRAAGGARHRRASRR